MDLAALGLLSLMLVRRARERLGKAGIRAEIFRDDAVYARAQGEHSTQAGMAYLMLTRFDPDAFGVQVPADRAGEAVRLLAAAGMTVSILEETEGEGSDSGRSAPVSEPTDHPYRGVTIELVCMRCGEPESGARPPGAPCAKCGGALIGHGEWLAARRKVARRWGIVFVLALIGAGALSPRFVSCGSAVHIGR